MGRGKKPALDVDDLPQGWLVEERPRASSAHVDMYFHDTNAGMKFRSTVEVNKHLGLDGRYIPCPIPIRVILDSSWSKRPTATSTTTREGSLPSQNDDKRKRDDMNE
ncbi:hypothetical protein ACP4OV_003548 [Aristida adscensionis]